MRAVIIGNGITGVTAAIRLRALQPDWQITMISGESTHHFSRPALMYIFMDHMTYRDTKPYEDHFWSEQRIELVRDWVTRIDTDARQLELHRGSPVRHDKLLIATGSTSNRFGWPGQDLDGVQGLYSLMDLEQLYTSVGDARRAVIVGGGLIGIELGEMLHSRGIHVTFLVREQSYWSNVLPAEESAMINRLILEQGMDLRLGTELEEIVDDGSGRCGAVRTSKGDTLPCQIVGLTAGVTPNIEVTAGSGIETNRGIVVDRSLRTSVTDVFAAGDCAEIKNETGGRNLLQQVWYTGRMQGEVAAHLMAGHERSYDPGIWFNSAKFLELEYQVYGKVNQRVEGEQSLYWEHADGKHALRIVHVEGKVIGLNFMGLRYRHRVCERWIAEERDASHVLDHLAEGAFDPELYRRHESAIVRDLRGQLA